MREARDGLSVDPAERIDGKTRAGRDQPRAQETQGLAVGMARRREDGREQRRIGARDAGSGEGARRMRGRGDHPRRFQRAPMGRLARTRLGQVQAVRTDLGRKRRVSGNQQDKPACMGDFDELAGESRARLGLGVAQDDRRAARKRTRGGGGVGDTRLVGHQDERGQVAARTACVESAGGPC